MLQTLRPPKPTKLSVDALAEALYAALESLWRVEQARARSCSATASSSFWQPPRDTSWRTRRARSWPLRGNPFVDFVASGSRWQGKVGCWGRACARRPRDAAPHHAAAGHGRQGPSEHGAPSWRHRGPQTRRAAHRGAGGAPTARCLTPLDADALRPAKEHRARVFGYVASGTCPKAPKAMVLANFCLKGLSRRPERPSVL